MPTPRCSLAHAQNVVTIPVEALVLNARKQKTVYVLDGDNRIQIRAVQVGLQGPKLAEITSGLNPGDRVVIGGQEKYQRRRSRSIRLLTPEPASETVQESGGMIDMKAEENNGGGN